MEKEIDLEPLKVAQYFINKCDVQAGDSITHLKIQKLLYYVQAWGLVFTGNSFFKEKFQAWSHGPVLPTVFHSLKQYRFQNIAGEIIAENLETTNKNVEVIENVWETYGELSAKHLEQLTHQEKPWIEARVGLLPEDKSINEIDQHTMCDYYAKLLKRDNDEKSNS